MSYQERTIDLIKLDPMRMRALIALRSLNLPDAYIAAGFVRNLIWDELSSVRTKLNDIDIIYYCVKDKTSERDFLLELKLKNIEPTFPWSVKNQARMHHKHNHQSYKSSKHAMSFWPEKQTSIAVRLNKQGDIEILHCFDLGIQFNNLVEYNPACNFEVFKNRLTTKKWREFWPYLKVEF